MSILYVENFNDIIFLQVSVHPGLSQESPHYIGAVAKVLAWSQAYMRGRKVHLHVVYKFNFRLITIFLSTNRTSAVL